MEAEKATKRTSNSSNTRTRRSEVGGDSTAARPMPQPGHCRTSVAFSNPQFGQAFAIQIIRFRLPAHRPRTRSTRAVHHLAEDGFHFMAGAFLVLAGDGGHELLRLMMRDEIDGCAAESAARQARAEAAGQGAGQLHQQVEFG